MRHSPYEARFRHEATSTALATPARPVALRLRRERIPLAARFRYCPGAGCRTGGDSVHRWALPRWSVRPRVLDEWDFDPGLGDIDLIAVLAEPPDEQVANASGADA